MKHFTIQELCASSTAKRQRIDNTPTAEVQTNLEALVDNILDPLREAYGKPIVVTSGYRSETLNKAVGGVRNSQHLVGQAADIVGTPHTKTEIRTLFRLIKSLRLPFDQLINERNFSWCHVSYRKDGNNRREVLNL